MKEKIKYAGAMLICFIAVLFIRMPVMADDGVPETAWRDNAATDFAGGSGTEADPYRIEDGAQLAKIAKAYHEGEENQLDGIINRGEWPRPWVQDSLEKVGFEFVD